MITDTLTAFVDGGTVLCPFINFSAESCLDGWFHREMAIRLVDGHHALGQPVRFQLSR
jgi:hypothetical protein